MKESVQGSINVHESQKTEVHMQVQNSLITNLHLIMYCQQRQPRVTVFLNVPNLEWCKMSDFTK